MDSRSDIDNAPECSSTSEVSRKRHQCFDDDDSNDEPSAKVLVEESPFNLESFCDEILLEIFQNLDGIELTAVGSTCTRFHFLVSDHRLWKNIDLTREPLSLPDISKILKSMHAQTESIKIRGMTQSYPQASWKNVTLSKSLLTKISETCTNLKVLELHHSFIDLEKISITDFPKNIKKLVFNTCYVRLPQLHNVFFTRIDTHFQCLEELSLEFCNWFETHDLVLFSKIPMLKKLCLRGCDNLKECVPYASIAARFGFKKLEHLDVRETPMSDSDIQCFSLSTSLKELLLECPLELRGPQDESEENESQRRSQNQTRPRPSFEEAQEPMEGTSRSQMLPTNNWVVTRYPRDGSENESIHIYINDVSYINIQPNSRNMNQANSSVQVDVGGDAQMPSRNLNRAITRSLWFERHYPPLFAAPRIHPISDRGICGFGLSGHNGPEGIIWIRAGNRPRNHCLNRFVIRHYKKVTDTSLCHLAQCSPYMVYLDVTGTSVSKDGIEKFKRGNPSCDVIADHIEDICNKPCSENDTE